MKFHEHIPVAVFTLLLAAQLAQGAAPTPAQGQAVAVLVTGSARYVEAGGNTGAITNGMVLKATTTVVTATNSTVLLNLGRNGNALIVKPESTVLLEKLEIHNPGSTNQFIKTRLDIKKGSALGSVNKLSTTSSFEVQTVNGVAGIRGTAYHIYSVGIFKCATGELLVTVKNTATGETSAFSVPAGQSCTTSGGTATLTPLSAEEMASMLTESTNISNAVFNLEGDAAAAAAAALAQLPAGAGAGAGIGEGAVATIAPVKKLRPVPPQPAPPSLDQPQPGAPNLPASPSLAPAPNTSAGAFAPTAGSPAPAAAARSASAPAAPASSAPAPAAPASSAPAPAAAALSTPAPAAPAPAAPAPAAPAPAAPAPAARAPAAPAPPAPAPPAPAPPAPPAPAR